MGYQREREDFIARLARWGVSTDVARALLRAATTYHRLAERECNGDDWCHGDTERAKRWGYLVLCPFKGKLACLCGKSAEESTHHYVTRSSVQLDAIVRRLAKLRPESGLDTIMFQDDPRGYEITVGWTDANGVLRTCGVPRKG